MKMNSMQPVVFNTISTVNLALEKVSSLGALCRLYQVTITTKIPKFYQRIVDTPPRRHRILHQCFCDKVTTHVDPGYPSTLMATSFNLPTHPNIVTPTHLVFKHQSETFETCEMLNIDRRTLLPQSFNEVGSWLQ